MHVRLLACLFLVAAAYAGDSRTAFYNQKVSSRTLALNQPVRIELTTVPRQVEGVSIEASVTDAITLSSATHWRLVGKPTATVDEKTRTVRVALSLLPRTVGEFALPTVPISWLSGDQVAEFGQVKVEARLVIGDDSRPLPAELESVSGFTWGCRLDAIRDRLPPGSISGDAERSLAKPVAGLELVFRRGELVEASIDAGDLSLETARASFLDRWGPPQIEDMNAITWVLGWTRINAVPGADGKGMRVQFAREDLVARITRSKVTDRVFVLLEGPKADKPTLAVPMPVSEPAKPAPK